MSRHTHTHARGRNLNHWYLIGWVHTYSMEILVSYGLVAQLSSCSKDTKNMDLIGRGCFLVSSKRNAWNANNQFGTPCVPSTPNTKLNSIKLANQTVVNHHLVIPSYPNNIRRMGCSSSRNTTSTPEKYNRLRQRRSWKSMQLMTVSVVKHMYYKCLHCFGYFFILEPQGIKLFVR